VIEDGDIVTGEIFSLLGMLETQHEPTIAVGKAHPDYERAAEVARAASDAGLEALRPGSLIGEVVAAKLAPVKKRAGTTSTR